MESTTSGILSPSTTAKTRAKIKAMTEIRPEEELYQAAEEVEEEVTAAIKEKAGNFQAHAEEESPPFKIEWIDKDKSEWWA
jgi:hypothetical protein